MGSTVMSATMACRDACCCCCLWIRGLQRCAEPLHELHAKQIAKSGKEDQIFKLKKAELLNSQTLPYIDSGNSTELPANNAKLASVHSSWKDS